MTPICDCSRDEMHAYQLEETREEDGQTSEFKQIPRRVMRSLNFFHFRIRG